MTDKNVHCTSQVKLTWPPQVVSLWLSSWPFYPEYLPDELWPLTTFPTLLVKKKNKRTIVTVCNVQDILFGGTAVISFAHRLEPELSCLNLFFTSLD